VCYGLEDVLCRLNTDGGRALRNGSCRYKHRWDAAVRLTSSEETETGGEKEVDVFVFELANDDVV